MPHPHVRFHFRANALVINLCITALETYEHMAKRHKYVHGALKANLKEAAKCWTRRLELTPVSVAISYPESCLLADAVHFLLECDAQDPHLGILRAPHRNEATHLAGALGDFNVTQFRLWQEDRASLPKPKIRTEADREQEQLAEIRDNMLRDVFMGGPRKRVNIWGQIVEDDYVLDTETTGLGVNEDRKIKAVVLKSREPKDDDKQFVYDLSNLKDEIVKEMHFDQANANFVEEGAIDHKARRQEGMVANFKKAYGGDAKDLRKEAKTMNFHCHPLQSSRVKLDDPEINEKLGEINKSLKGLGEMAKLARELPGGGALQYKPSMRVKLKSR